MSTGLFMGVRESFTEEAQDGAKALLKAIDHALVKNGLGPYFDPEPIPNVYNGHLFGRSALDHHSSRVLADIAGREVQSKQTPNLSLIRDNPFRVVFVPADLKRPVETSYRERIAGDLVSIWMGSLDGLLRELSWLAVDLGIPMQDGRVTDEIAIAINDFKVLNASDSSELIEDHRTAWLALYEGARLASANGVALTLAG
jgi:hypothetical protein